MEKTGFKEIELKLPTDYSESQLNRTVSIKLGIRKFSFDIIKKSLDARKKNNIHWKIRLRVFSKELRGTEFYKEKKLKISYKKRNKKIIVVGSGPAGFFSAYLLALSGFQVTIIEKGTDVNQRHKDILDFESKGLFKNHSNYCCGEGGAGTFSDGKLTSRTKNITVEKQFILDNFIDSGAPQEIRYLSKPHIGSDNLRKVVLNLRKKFENAGGILVFNSTVGNFTIHKNNKISVHTAEKNYEADFLIFAPGHSNYDTFRLLYDKRINFRIKPFAIGVRVEHPQELINIAQWNVPKLNGVKAADYKLTYTASNGIPVYSFCMCPGGKVVQASPKKGLNIVNGVSNYSRNSPFANSAIVAGLDIRKILKKETGFFQAIDWLESLEKKVFDLTNSFSVPGNIIGNFVNDNACSDFPKNSYCPGIFPYDFKNLFPPEIILALKEGFNNFSRKIKGFETGIMMGLESKTSSPVQVIRDEFGRCEGFGNVFIIGEGSGYTGGIISSAVDGIKAAIGIIKAF